MADEKLHNRDAVINMLEANRARLGPRIRERLRNEAGIDEAALKPNYSLAEHDAMVKVFAEELYPGRPLEEATFEVGRSLLANYGRGVLGRALFSVIRLVGPIRILKRVPEYYRMTNNFAEVTISVTGPKSYDLEHNEIGGYPHYMRGSMQGSGELIGLTGYSVELLEYDGHRGRFRVSWS
ncbi:MAG: DUF2378 family protein [Archangiaceae bacterium]|nr:DUF2378 family protein [Archangiaceae bacterium]